MRSDSMPAQSFEQNGGDNDFDTSDESQTDSGVDGARNPALRGALSDEQLAEILAKRRIRCEDTSRLVPCWICTRKHDARHTDKPLSVMMSLRGGTSFMHAC